MNLLPSSFKESSEIAIHLYHIVDSSKGKQLGGVVAVAKDLMATRFVHLISLVKGCRTYHRAASDGAVSMASRRRCGEREGFRYGCHGNDAFF
jgi:hypothetical protein